MQLRILNSQKHSLQAIHLLILKAVISNNFSFWDLYMLAIKSAAPVKKSANLAGQSCGLAFHSYLLGTCETWPIGVLLHDSPACPSGINPADTP